MSDTNEYNYKSLDDFAPQPIVQGPELAGRGQRLGAAILDGLIGLSITLPLTFLLTGNWVATNKVSETRSTWQSILLSNTISFDTIGLTLLSMGLFLALQSWFIYTKGQTLGKMAVHIAINNFETTDRASYSQIVLKRMLLIDLIQFVPIAGSIFGLVDILFIF